ncbi:MAG: alpha/beta fold hydrolase [Pseudomonadota bacterium]
MTEKAVLLGEQRRLVGIVTRAGPATGLPAVVILNTGIIHRVGHHRMYVTLARRLARQGYAVLRFDFSGIGDSPPRTDDLAPLEANLASLGQVIDWVEETLGARRMVLIGLCSGADQAAIYAGQDPRVRGTMLIDPSIPRTTRYYLISAWRRVRQAKPWRNLVTGRTRFWRRLGALFGGTPPPLRQYEAARPDLETPEAVAFLEGAYQRTVDNGAELLAVFTGGHHQWHNYRRQILEALPKVRFGRQLELHYYADCDHTFTYEAQRARLFALLEAWMARKVPADNAAGDSAGDVAGSTARSTARGPEKPVN